MDFKTKDRKKVSFEQKTFTELWLGLTEAERTELRYELVGSLRCTMQTVRNYASGATRPGYPVIKEICSVVSRVTGRKCLPKVLFP